MSARIHFYLNDREVHASLPDGMLVLDYLRSVERRTGTKEGCREGDCGACAVLVGTLENDRVSYNSVTSCLMPVGELHGKHLVTIEGLNMDHLSPVQEAIVDLGGSQCGFCTPGIVVSLTGYLIEKKGPVSREAIKSSLGGHLCRCTGYRSLKDASSLLATKTDDLVSVDDLIANNVIPKYFRTIPERLRLIGSKNGSKQPDGATFNVAGGTDIYVQQGDKLATTSTEVLNLHPDLKGIEKTNTHLIVGALTTFEEFGQHPDVAAVIPDIADYMQEIASIQIRNRATLGGNIINASPIGDMTILILALNANLELRSGTSSRHVPIRDFYLGYKTLDRKEDEILTRLHIPLPPDNSRINWEKVSKRKYLDIASVNSAAIISANNDIIEAATITVGGVAPVPFILSRTNTFLAGKKISADIISAAVDIALEEISPISDVRGSAEYKRLLTRQFVIAHFATMYPEYVSAEVLV